MTLSPSSTSQVDLVLGRYSLGRRLGSGGFGTVYEGWDVTLERAVAVKVIDGAASPPERARREALAAGRLDHPGVVAVLDAGEEAGARYLVSELVRGSTLAQLAASGRLSDRDVLRIGLALADALEHAHSRGVVHRDVKPQNVIVPDKPRPGDWRAAAKLADFGVAHLVGDEPLTRTGDVVGTFAYMAPEQAAGEPVDERTDVYSLALLVYEALSGVNPVRGPTPAATVRRIGTRLESLATHRGDLPPALITAIDGALDPEPDYRTELADLADGLESGLDEADDDAATGSGIIAPHPIEQGRSRRVPAGVWRIVSAGTSGAAAAALLTMTGAEIPAGLVFLLSFAACALVPRLGFLVTVVTVAAVMASQAEALVPLSLALLVAVAGSAALLPRRGVAWPVPLIAPAAALVMLAPAYVAVAARFAGPWSRAALAALGAGCLLAVEFLGQVPLLFSSGGAVVSAPAVFALPLMGLWALSAAVAPWVIRGAGVQRLVSASAWSAAVVAGTAAVPSLAGEPSATPEAAGLLLSGVVAAALAAWPRP